MKSQRSSLEVSLLCSEIKIVPHFWMDLYFHNVVFKMSSVFVMKRNFSFSSRLLITTIKNCFEIVLYFSSSFTVFLTFELQGSNWSSICCICSIAIFDSRWNGSWILCSDLAVSF